MKVSIVAEGGGMRGAYVLGALDALHSLGLKRVDYVAGASVSVGTLAYYVSGELDKARDILIHDLPKSRFISFMNFFRIGRYVDIDFVIDKLFKRKLNIKKTRRSRIKFIFPLACAETGKAKYFSNRSKHDFFELLRGAMAVPIGYNKTIKIDGKHYFDGAYTDPLPVDVPGIKESKKIIILTKNKKYPKWIFILERWLSRLNKFRIKPGVYKKQKENEILYNKRLKDVLNLEKNGDIIIRPEVPMSYTDYSQKNNLECFKRGRKDVLSCLKIENLIKKLKKSNKRNFYFSEQIL